MATDNRPYKIYHEKNELTKYLKKMHKKKAILALE